MATKVERLAVTKLTTEVSFGSSGTTVFTADSDYLLSVIATNTSGDNATVHIYVVPSGASSTDQYGLIAYNLTLSGYNAYETFRFGVNDTDVVKVAGSPGVSFYVQGIDQLAV